MLSALVFAAAIAGTQADPLDITSDLVGVCCQPSRMANSLTSAILHYHTVDSYRVTIRAFHADAEEHIRYYYRKPGFVRMEFIRPHDGAVLVYSPLTKRVRLWPFGTGRFPEFNLNPGNPLIRSSRGQHVDRSDVGVLFENVRALREAGNIEMSGEEDAGGRRMLHLIVTGAGNFAVADVHRYELWLDMENQFPVRIISRDQQDAVIETVMMEDLEINATLPEALFNPQER